MGINRLNESYQFNTFTKTFPNKGNLVYEYNPFRNYRLEEDTIYYKNRLWNYQEFCLDVLKYEGHQPGEEYEENGKILTYNKSWKEILQDLIKVKDENGGYKYEWDSEKIPHTETPPIIYQKGQLVDFETNELHFDLKHPVNVTPQWSYDNSVNLILNDGKNPPRLINSRFSPTEKNKYQICDRKGLNDTNIYSQGIEFDIDTSLYRKTTTIPRLKFLGVQYGGNLSIGNYHFYFRYQDEDGNMSDFVAESGLVSLFIGSTPDSIISGFRNENSHKLVKFFITNTDISYNKILVYYTKCTSDIYQNATTQAYKIDQEYLINHSSNTVITITGFEPTVEVPISDINPMYQIYGSVETQTIAQNRLFFGNVDQPEIPYEDLADCALRFLPVLKTDDYNFNINTDYVGSTANTYYDPSYIYSSVGYWDDEIYRFGIVFIQSDNTLTPVFNTRGIEDLTDGFDAYTDEEFYKNKDKDKGRSYITYNEETFVLNNLTSGKQLENCKGVISIQHSNVKSVIGINFKVKKEVVDYLQTNLKIKGWFFVRQKRIPTTLCQAYTIAIDNESNTPVLPTKDKKYKTESFLSQNKISIKKNIESLLKGITQEKVERLLSNDKDRQITLDNTYIRKQAAICPEYDINSPYLNTLFTGSEFSIRGSISPKYLTQTGKHFTVEEKDWVRDVNYNYAKIIGVEDNVKLVAIGSSMFSARAGEAEEAFRFEYAGYKNKITEASNLLRGSYGPYLGITGYEKDGELIDIKIPGYSKSNLPDYFKIRYNDESSYYAISDRIDLSNYQEWYKDDIEEYCTLNEALYRGDCYICQFTHRLNRNFQDPSTPTNSTIVDPKCWAENFEFSDGVLKKENFEKINLGDVNAVGLGMWITFTLRSTFNLNIRALDDSVVDEVGLTGHARGFYPYYPMSTNGTYKIPEALCYNKGFQNSVSDRTNFLVPDVPWIKNEFSNRVAYSNIQLIDGFRNGFRVFEGINYRDYPKTYGSITKLVELSGSLVCIFEHGVALIPVNERTVAAEGVGGNAYINTPNVLPQNPNIISDTFGSQWRESIIKTPYGIYGVDTIAKKIWRTNGKDLECLSDFKVQEFLNQNISLTERELDPIIGIRNVKTHYNAFKHDVMFTFYDNLHGFQEKVWNLCYNEIRQQWTTFYSWIPSYSENIDNQYFSFDRNTSKWIAKLGISKEGSDFQDGVVLTENVIPNKFTVLSELSEEEEFKYIEFKKGKETYYGPIIGKLNLVERDLPNKDSGVSYKITYELDRDNFGNWKNFGIHNNGDTSYLYLKTNAVDLCSEFFVRINKDGEKLKDPKGKDNEIWKSNIQNPTYSIYKDEQGRRKNLEQDKIVNGDSIVILLNIKANVELQISGAEQTLTESYIDGYKNQMKIDAGYYQSTIAVIPEYNKQFLTTDFWKHGQAGIIDIVDKINPTYWYGKQHPFEFEFIVNDKPQFHKIFNNLQIVSNNAEPESFHYEIVGDCYEFAKDKKNMYIRQEATKALYQYNEVDIIYDPDYSNLEEEQRLIKDTKGNDIPGLYDKSTLLPLYYSRQDKFNEIEDYYHLKDLPNKDFSSLSGGEIVRYKTLDEYRIWNHAKAIDLNSKGRLRGNMQYKEDIWNVQINPINIVQKNESKWENGKIPIELGQSPIPDEILKEGYFDTLGDDRRIVSWNWTESQNKEVKMKDKWIKIRVRYKGDKLAIISAIYTLYSISYS